jgi:stage II sporulation protein D
LNFKYSFQDEPDFEELAAALSAVVSIVLEPQLGPSDRFPAGSTWAQIARLEGTAETIDSRVDALEQIRMHPWQRSVQTFLAAGLLTSLLFACSTTPASAFWFFKHHKHDDSIDSTTNAAPATPPPTTSSSRPSVLSVPVYRLLPSQSIRPAPPRAPSATTRPTISNVNKVSNNGRLIAPLPLDSIAAPIDSAIVKPSAIRVGLQIGGTTADLIALDGAVVSDYQTGSRLTSLSPQSRWLLRLESQTLVFKPKDWFQVTDLAKTNNQPGDRVRTVSYRTPSTPSSFLEHSVRVPLNSGGVQRALLITPNSNGDESGLFSLNGKFYRGSLIIQPNQIGAQASSSLNFINMVDLEDYLLSVVPSEMPSAWPVESLKAQAIAARTYALANLGKHGKDGFDLRDTTDDQVYSGVKAESTNSNRAVAETNGVVMTYGGKPICAYFHSASGGTTESSENVWGKELPYLKAVQDYDDQSPHASWSRIFDVGQLENTLAPELGQLLSIVVLARTSSQRAHQVLLIGTQGTQIAAAETIRRQLKLPSTNFNVNPIDGSYAFIGKGFGHGLGLSQWGAKSLAEQGYNAAQIVTYYYRNVTLERVTGPPSN